MDIKAIEDFHKKLDSLVDYHGCLCEENRDFVCNENTPGGQAPDKIIYDRVMRIWEGLNNAFSCVSDIPVHLVK